MPLRKKTLLDGLPTAVTILHPTENRYIREGLQLLKEQDALKEIRLAELRREIQLGIDSGESTPLNMNEIIAKAKQQRQEKEST
ncbi:MAG: type II toxin-antitoxin system ParD family antitoxin [Pyrinomonadaceae bacterium]|nr:type II toxin-antitoxin system ParD family antitoxin [Pyrinomonadaceae bacterium]